MGWQCVPQSIGLVRGEPKKGQKNRSNGEPICKETGSERASKSTTIDRSRSKDNVYQIYDASGEWVDTDNPRGKDMWEAMVAEVDEYRSTYVDKNGKERSRRLPQQAIIGVQVIINPPSEVADTWDRETHYQFQDDASEVLAEIEPRLFRRSNVRMRAHHFDEGLPERGADTHTVYVARDADGKYCGSIYDAKLRQRMAAEFAVKMRERGWDIDDPELTDWERYGELAAAAEGEEGAFKLDKPSGEFKAGDCVRFANPEYRAEIDAKRERTGRSQPEFAAAQQAEERAAKAVKKMQQAVNRTNEEERKASEAQGRARKANREADNAENRRDAALLEAAASEARAAAVGDLVAKADAAEERERASAEKIEANIKALESMSGDEFTWRGQTFKGAAGKRRERDELDEQITSKRDELRKLTELAAGVEDSIDAAQQDEGDDELTKFRRYIQSDDFKTAHPVAAAALAPVMEIIEDAMKLYRQRQVMRRQTLRERLAEADEAMKPRREEMLAKRHTPDGAPTAHSSGIEMGG